MSYLCAIVKMSVVQGARRSVQWCISVVGAISTTMCLWYRVLEERIPYFVRVTIYYIVYVPFFTIYIQYRVLEGGIHSLTFSSLCATYRVLEGRIPSLSLSSLCATYRVIEGIIPSLSLSSLCAIVYNVCTVQKARERIHILSFFSLRTILYNVCILQGDRRKDS